ncbi:hypothetical protein [Empedobacter falsenii]|uniref:Uncharacterized protein n=1 Tax=Empedobacter falsenii TaxID=343874 RepID=A0A427BHR8_9FLAO|nr:hypothetical protein [Empedobacter falsenii]RRT87928.1 hypothetical protein EGI88_12795 [Empedobacter falsenii]RRT88762.1 hypothetical protein EGI89_12795 [Empedobacter falsenii]HAD79808.1 hypothetical protein [Flavobacteriaceae bacterium]
MPEVTFRGTGQLNGPVPINKTIEVDIQTAKNLGGSKKDEVKLAILAIHYPGVKINPRQIGMEIKYDTPKQKAKTEKNKTEINEKKPITFFSILKFLIFLPFKLVWWFLKFASKG